MCGRGLVNEYGCETGDERKNDDQLEDLAPPGNHGQGSFLVVSALGAELTQSPSSALLLRFASFVATGPCQETHENDERDDGDNGPDFIPISDSTVKQDFSHVVSPAGAEGVSCVFWQRLWRTR